ncbi:MAG: SDR family oxidoreductase [Flavobacteriia bacterium]|nr:SDR family oxidoreductase [Flavobacteriia bacterium]
MRSYHNKVVWITGASSGIGEAMAREFANQGAILVLAARNVQKLNQIKDSLPNAEVHTVISLDLTDLSKVDALVSSVIDQVGRVDVLVNNGGISQRSLVGETPLEVDRKIMEVNFFGAVGLTKALLPSLREVKGQIIVISSISGKFGFFLRSTYAAAKHALHGFFESLALEEEGKVRVTIACPGKINTPISMSALNEKGERHNAMDDNQSTGMDVDVCAHKIIRAARKNRREVLIGKKEIIPVYLKRYFPALFWRIIRNQKAV